MKAGAVIEGALERLSDMDRWCQGHFAADAAGRPVVVSSPSAVRWSLLGALHAATSDHPYLLAAATDYVWEAVRRATGGGARDIEAYNDSAHTTHGDVVRVLREALRLAGG